MFDKLKGLMDMKNKMMEVKRELEKVIFDVSSTNGLVNIAMNAAQEVKEVRINKDLKEIEKRDLESAVKEAYEQAVKRSRDIAAQKMRNITGLNIPGM